MLMKKKFINKTKKLLQNRYFISAYCVVVFFIVLSLFQVFDVGFIVTPEPDIEITFPVVSISCLFNSKK